MRQYPRKKIHLPISIKRDPSQDPITFDQTTFFHSFFPENRSIEGDWNNPCCQKNKSITITVYKLLETTSNRDLYL